MVAVSSFIATALASLLSSPPSRSLLFFAPSLPLTNRQTAAMMSLKSLEPSAKSDQSQNKQFCP